MIKARKFVNELGNEIEMCVHDLDDGVTVCALSLTSQVEHVWTEAEARVLRALLNDFIEDTDEQRIAAYFNLF